METQKKEIAISKSFIKKTFVYLLYAILFSFLTLLLVQHFGEIFIEKILNLHTFETFGEKIRYNSPLHPHFFYPDLPPIYYAFNPSGYSYNLDDIEYSTKIFKIYIPDLLENCKMKFFILFIVTLTLIYLISNLKNKYSIKLK